jgi:hypothetical protein
MSTGVKTHRITDPNDDTRFVDVDPYVIEGIVRCQGTIDQTVSGHPLSGSYNTNAASTTDNGAGDTEVSFTNSFSSVDYKSVGTTNSSQGRGSVVNLNNDAVGSVDLLHSNPSNSAFDSNEVKFIITGELA